MAQAQTTYAAKDWQRRPWHNLPPTSSGIKLFRLEMQHVYAGDIQGEGSVQYFVAQNEAGEVNFVGLESVIGSVNGLAGSFVLQRVGNCDEGRIKETLTILHGSGSDELRTLTGRSRIEHTQHQESYTLILDYEL